MNPLTFIQERIAAMLQADPLFTPEDPKKKIEVLTQKLGDLQNQITKKVGSLGICATVFTPGVTLPETEFGPFDIEVPYVVEIAESVMINKTGVCAFDLACATMEICHGAWTGIGNPEYNRIRLTNTPLVLQEVTPIYQVNLVAIATLTPRRPKLPADA